MKSYKTFLDDRKKSVHEQIEQIESYKPEILELEELPNLLGESVRHHDSTIDPPNILMMRRVSIRQYPNKQRVALYYVDKINKYVTVPYAAMQWSSGSVPTEEEFKFDIIKQLNEIISTKTNYELYFEGGSSLNVNVDMAKQVLKLYKSLSEENKKQLISVACRSKEDFLNIQNFTKQL